MQRAGLRLHCGNPPPPPPDTKKGPAYQPIMTDECGELTQQQMSELYNINQLNAQFYKLIFNFLCLLYFSNLVSSVLGRHLSMQYGMFICIGVSDLVGM